MSTRKQDEDLQRIREDIEMEGHKPTDEEIWDRYNDEKREERRAQNREEEQRRRGH